MARFRHRSLRPGGESAELPARGERKWYVCGKRRQAEMREMEQITGINTVIYYAPTILQGVGFSEGGAIADTALGVGLVNVGFTVLAARIIDRAGRCSSSGSSP